MTLVLTNTLDAGPHEPCTLVLLVRDEKNELEVPFRGGTYWLFMFALGSDLKPAWTRRAMNVGPIAAGARDRALRVWREIAIEGKD